MNVANLNYNNYFNMLKGSIHVKRMAEIEQEMANVVDLYGEADSDYCKERIAELIKEYDATVDKLRQLI